MALRDKWDEKIFINQPLVVVSDNCQLEVGKLVKTIMEWGNVFLVIDTLAPNTITREEYYAKWKEGMGEYDEYITTQKTMRYVKENVVGIWNSKAWYKDELRYLLDV